MRRDPCARERRTPGLAHSSFHAAQASSHVTSRRLLWAWAVGLRLPMPTPGVTGGGVRGWWGRVSGCGCDGGIARRGSAVGLAWGVGGWAAS